MLELGLLELEPTQIQIGRATLMNACEEQDIKESLLAFFVMAAKRPKLPDVDKSQVRGWMTEAEVKQECEDEVERICETNTETPDSGRFNITFDVDDALHKLEEEGVVDVTTNAAGTRVYRAKHVADAIFAIGRTKYRPHDEVSRQANHENGAN